MRLFSSSSSQEGRGISRLTSIARDFDFRWIRISQILAPRRTIFRIAPRLELSLLLPFTAVYARSGAQDVINAINSLPDNAGILPLSAKFVGGT